MVHEPIHFPQNSIDFKAFLIGFTLFFPFFFPLCSYLVLLQEKSIAEMLHS